MHRRLAGLLAAGTVTAATCLVVAAAPHAGSAPAAPTAATPARAPDRQVITLVTGDQVTVSTDARGRQYAEVRPGAGRARVAFFRRSHGNDLSVIPSDAAPLLAAGRLDPALFDVSGLLRDGYGDSARPDLPLLVGYAPGTRAPAATRALPTLNAAAVTDRKAAAGTLWPTLRGRTVAHVWLDATVHARLDHSVPQISAPVAWQHGWTGSGVTVAVLDTGIDATHPDLADAVASSRDFTGNPDGIRDGNGHGTHVASIITGSGAASGGRYAGVAPDARLAIGKVLDDNGGGTLSQVIAGMEWAALDQHARVVNMSLGIDLPSDGTDPVSAAVDALTARTGTLFVIAAGNAGGDGTVGIPAVADSALTVGAVDGEDNLADFSSRGPRPGNAGVKPDVTAPGVGIVAARASGTEAGEPVDEAYVRLSGTSMATPHVAGAAALLAQQHPDWTATRLKTALMNTADFQPGTPVYGQGAGRIDVGRAVTGGEVSAAPASLAFDLPGTSSRTVTFRNDGPAARRLTLAVPAPLAVDPAEVLVPAGGTARATVTAVPGAGSGLLTATDGATRVLGVPVGVVSEPPLHTVRITGIDRTGHSGPSTVDILPWADLVNLATGEYAPVFLSGNGIAAKVPAGRYDLTAYVDTAGPDGQIASSTLVTIPALTVTGDMSVTADARRANRLSITLDSRTAVPSGVDIAGVAQTVAGTFIASGIGSADPAVGLYASATPAVRDRPYAFYVKAIRAEPLGGPAPRAYHLAVLEQGRVPARLALRIRDRDLARLDTRYHADGSELTGVRSTIQVLPGEHFPLGGGDYPVRLPGARTELYSASPRLGWARWLSAGLTADSQELFEAARDVPLRPGLRARADWNSAAFGATIATGPRGKCRDAVLVVAYPFTGSGALQQFTDGSSQLTASKDGTVLGSVEGNVGCFPTPPGAGSYALHLSARRDLPWMALGTQLDVTWTSAYTPDFDAPFDGPPVINLSTDGDFDPRNRAAGDRPFRLGVTARLETVFGPAPARTPIAVTSAEISTDDGATWRRVPVLAAGPDRSTVLVPAVRGARYVSLRLRAADSSGDSVEQTVIRAYGVR